MIRRGRGTTRRKKKPPAPVPSPSVDTPTSPPPSLAQTRQERIQQARQHRGKRRWGSTLFRLGDAVETVLSSVGITEEVVTKWLGPGCGCRDRKKRLNRFSEWVHAKLRGEEPPPPAELVPTTPPEGLK